MTEYIGCMGYEGERKRKSKDYDSVTTPKFDYVVSHTGSPLSLIIMLQVK